MSWLIYLQFFSIGLFFVFFLSFFIYFRTSDIVRRCQNFLWLAVALTFCLIVLGAFTRLTDSGLGCPDWPGCYGKVHPISALKEIRAAELVYPDGPVTLKKAWIEMIHRYLAIVLGVLIMILTFYGFRLPRLFRPKKKLIVLPVIFVFLQGILGALTVTHRLSPVIVTAHLFMGMLFLALLVWLALSFSQTKFCFSKENFFMMNRLNYLCLVLFFLLIFQIILGGLVSSHGAALACPDFPKCQNKWLPEMDFKQAFGWALLKINLLEGLPMPALIAMHWVHRLVAFLFFLGTLTLAYQARKIHFLSRSAVLLVFLASLQFVVGLSIILWKLPLFLAILHTAIASFLVITVVFFFKRVRILSSELFD